MFDKFRISHCDSGEAIEHNGTYDLSFADVLDWLRLHRNADQWQPFNDSPEPIGVQIQYVVFDPDEGPILLSLSDEDLQTLHGFANFSD